MRVPRGRPVTVVGCDVVSVERIARTLARREQFRTRVFTSRELADARRGGVAEASATEHERLAARFAAKEAARKALRDLSLGFHDTEVRTDASGAPTLYVRGQRSTLDLSLSHDGDVAFAVVTGAFARDGRGDCRSRGRSLFGWLPLRMRETAPSLARASSVSGAPPGAARATERQEAHR